MANYYQKVNNMAQLKNGMFPTKQLPIKLYYWPTPNGWKLTLFLEECGVPYEVVPVNIGAGEQHEDWFMKISERKKADKTSKIVSKFTIFIKISQKI